MTVTILLGVLATCLGFFVLIVAPLVVYQSFYKVGTNEKIVFYFWGSYQYTVVNDTYWNRVWMANENNAQAKVDDHGTVKRGKWKGGWAFGLWPIYLGYRVPTDQFDVPIHASQSYTSSENDDLPRVRVEIDATLQFRLSDNPIYLGMVFPLFEQNTIEDYLSKKKRDLTNSEVLVQDNGGTGRTHKVKRIAMLFYNVINRPMLEAIRTAATGFTFSTVPAPGGGAANDIVRERVAFETRVKEILAEDDDTIFRQAKLLNDGATPAESLLVCNYIGENVQLQPTSENDSEAIKAIDYSFIGQQEGRRQQALEKLRRVGEAQGIEQLATQLGLDTERQKAFLMDVLRTREGNINLTSVDLSEAQDVLAAIQRYLGS